MYKRLYDFLEVNKILHSLQSSFRRKHSTSHTLISMTEKIRNSIDNILLLTELVGQCRNILPLAFSALTSLLSVNTENAAGNIFLH